MKAFLAKYAGPVIFGLLLAGVVSGVVFGMFAIANNAQEDADNQIRCETIDAEYVAQLDQCEKAGELLPVPGGE